MHTQGPVQRAVPASAQGLRVHTHRGARPGLGARGTPREGLGGQQTWGPAHAGCSGAMSLSLTRPRPDDVHVESNAQQPPERERRRGASPQNRGEMPGGARLQNRGDTPGGASHLEPGERHLESANHLDLGKEKPECRVCPCEQTGLWWLLRHLSEHHAPILPER